MNNETEQKHRVWIDSGTTLDDITEYEFDTLAELNAFLMGCQEVAGMNEDVKFVQIDTQEEFEARKREIEIENAVEGEDE